MRRDARRRNDDFGFRNLMFWAGAVLLLAVITFGITYAVYSSKVKNEARVSKLNSQKIGELVPNIQTEDETKSASTLIGKTVNEVIEEKVDENIENNIIEETSLNNVEENKNHEDTVKKEDDISIKKLEENQSKKELSFKMPVEGDIVKEFAKDNLVYSETLKEWITHTGIDIKADKTTVVKVAEEGTVKSIKNDPRYGLTVTVEHDGGFKTVYANLLTAEFVSEGEMLTQGQTVGTVGTTANFEIADDPHLHFEIWKDNEQVDPTIYIK